MTWDELLAEFRALGGVAENVTLGNGPFGRGVFVVDAARSATLHAPENLLVPTDALEIRDGRMKVKPGAPLGDRERAFFEAYHANFCWSAGVFGEIQASQKAWSELPGDVVHAIKTMGALLDPEVRFLPPTTEVCFYQFVRSRDAQYQGRLCMLPVVDLVNHSSRASPYVLTNGIGVTGHFTGEMLVRYNGRDSWSNALTYGFAELASFAYSIGIGVDLFGRYQLSVRRDVAEVEFREGAGFPIVKLDGNAIDLSFLLLGHYAATDVPRGMFRSVMAPYLSVAEADQVFDSIAHFNRLKFLNLVRLLRGHDGTIVRMLESAALDQLEILSGCVGSRDFSPAAGALLRKI
ncbi:MAG: hypothetical protein JOY98_14505 [Candidatus Eremiobacteraeota bacterium]|nr:hypothetical protein [Candidatus Eremiobacteraeota bacterium]